MVAVPDLLGRLQGKIFNAPVFLERMTGGTEMCAYVLATDVDMTPLDGFGLTGWDRGFGDLRVQPDLDTVRMLPHRPQTALLIGTALHDDGTPVEVAPRHVLEAQLQRLRDLGYLVKAGVESEFVLYTDGPTDRQPAWPDNLDYSLQHPPIANDFFRQLADTLNEAGIVHEAIKTEGAAGQAEVTFAYGQALKACDDYAVFRHLVRDLAARHGMTPAFMAAPQTGVGSGLHLHLSLWTENDKPAFAHHRGEDLPPVMERAVAGMLSALPHLAPLYAPCVNSFKRYWPHSFAPTRFNWGHDHRGCAIRVTGHGSGAHLEVRLAGADANAYLALAAYTAAIAHGIEEGLTPRPACDGDAYEELDSVPVPADLGEALIRFADSTIARRLLGKEVVRHYARAARAEFAWYRRHVTDLERERGIR
ncbi:glutamine synthetase family protein [Streptomyces sp. H51]|uniref:glutamine synthetase family protein n=1 Tax=Streptomyces sp. H51 TaxID=3111770 RepID=UPI002D772358|nr:glutamine synthetase family protein [Streptomyces sp. H51]